MSSSTTRSIRTRGGCSARSRALDGPRQERLHSIKGSPPSLINAPAGCKFRTRCPHAFEKCTQEPALENRVEVPGHLDRCWLDVEYKRAMRDATISGHTEAA